MYIVQIGTVLCRTGTGYLLVDNHPACTVWLIQQYDDRVMHDIERENKKQYKYNF